MSIKKNDFTVSDVVNGFCYNCLGKTWYDMVTSVLFRKENAVMVEYITDYGKTGYANLYFKDDGSYDYALASSDKDSDTYEMHKYYFFNR